jgi:hypothetical protein
VDPDLTSDVDPDLTSDVDPDLTSDVDPELVSDVVPDPDLAEVDEGDATTTTTYHGHARAILEKRCVLCHQEGGGTPFSMTWNPDEWAGGPAWWTEMSMNAIADGRMPPWLPAPDCRPVLDDRTLLPHERAVLEVWQAEGFALGEEDAGPSLGDPAPEPGSDPSLVTDAGGPYTADKTKPDDYRCFLLEATFDTDRFATRTMVWPGAKDVVHHVMLFLVQSGGVGTVEALDEGEEGLGYACFGGPGVSAQFIGGWVPGTGAFDIPGGAAMEIEAESRIVMQIHYNTSDLDPDAEIEADMTEVALWLLPEGETPEHLLWFWPFANWQISILANDPNSVHVKDTTFPWNGEVVGVGPHMHNLGTEIRASVVDENDDTSCLVEIPAWDFNWQQIYLFEEGEEVFVHGLSRHSLTCVYDNSPENQPVVNGVQSDPTHVTWGESTFDEMCVNYVLVTAPYEGTLYACGNFDWCVDHCEGDFACVHGCILGTGNGCHGCLTDAYEACGQEHCTADTLAAVECTQTCVEAGVDETSCKVGECRDLWQAVHGCLGPLMMTQACEAYFQACDLGP